MPKLSFGLSDFIGDHLKVSWIFDRSDHVLIDELTADLKTPFAMD
ncbi:MAG: hypothetical protein OXH85_14180 [Truepera sp.]|nr:hypothetical protein [Truepera sp.]